MVQQGKRNSEALQLAVLPTLHNYVQSTSGTSTCLQAATSQRPSLLVRLQGSSDLLSSLLANRSAIEVNLRHLGVIALNDLHD